jgi:hypothetical protein
VLDGTRYEIKVTREGSEKLAVVINGEVSPDGTFALAPAKARKRTAVDT